MFGAQQQATEPMGNRLSKIVTRTGDTGTSGLADGSRLPKHHPRFAAMGDVDELNSQVGVLLAAGVPHDLARVLEPIQHALFNLGGQLAMPEMELLTADHVATLDKAVETLNADLPPLKEFVLPRGRPATAQAHVARAVCRRAERSLWALIDSDDSVPTLLAQYLNRLSDLLFICARHLARGDNPSEATWEA